MTVAVLDKTKNRVCIIRQIPNEINVRDFLLDHGYIDFEWMITEDKPVVQTYKVEPRLELVYDYNA